MSFTGNVRAFFAARRAEKEMNSGRFAQARSLFASSLALRDSPQARAKMALCIWDSGETAAAVREGEKACAAMPPGNPARLFHAMVLAEEGRFEDAMKIVAGVRSADPGNPFASGVEVLALLKMGKTREASAGLKSFVFGSPVFRAHLLTAIEQHLNRTQQRKKWVESYLECVL